MPSELCPHRVGGCGYGEVFYSVGSKVELLTSIRVCAGPALL